MELIDIENIDYVRLEDSLHCLEHHKGDEVECVICAPLVEAIPKDQYETRLKADMVAMLTEIQLEIEEIRLDRPLFSRGYECYGYEDKTPTEIQQECSDVIQQKINELKAESEET